MGAGKVSRNVMASPTDLLDSQRTRTLGMKKMIYNLRAATSYRTARASRAVVSCDHPAAPKKAYKALLTPSDGHNASAKMTRTTNALSFCQKLILTRRSHWSGEVSKAFDGAREGAPAILSPTVNVSTLRAGRRRLSCPRRATETWCGQQRSTAL